MAQVARENARSLDGVPNEGSAVQGSLAEQGKMTHVKPVSSARGPSLETSAGLAELVGSQQGEGGAVRVCCEEPVHFLVAAAIFLDPV